MPTCVPSSIAMRVYSTAMRPYLPSSYGSVGIFVGGASDFSTRSPGGVEATFGNMQNGTTALSASSEWSFAISGPPAEYGIFWACEIVGSTAKVITTTSIVTRRAGRSTFDERLGEIRWQTWAIIVAPFSPSIVIVYEGMF